MRYGLIGEKLSHSFSKIIHETLASYQYDLIPLSKEEFKQFMEDKNFTALNVTIPYKQAVIPYLDEIDDAANAIHAVNTIVHKNGKLIGHNTDFGGFLYMLEKHHIEIKDKDVLVLGNGGAAKAIIAALKHLSAKQIIIVNRHATNGAISYEEAYQNNPNVDVIVNTTPVGMYPDNDGCVIDLNQFHNLSAVVDIVYNPLLTKICQNAKTKHIPYVCGLEMLVAQAKLSIEYFLDTKLDDQCIDDMYQTLLKKQCNLVLIGMPSCGKSTIAKIISEKLQKEYIDLDEEISKHANKSIPDIFAQDGEAHFRDLETEVIKATAKLSNKIIATGGGAILRKENMDALAQNAHIIYLQRDLALLTQVDKNRPLLKDPSAIHRLYEQRKERYELYADEIITNNQDAMTCADDIVARFKNQYLSL